jgi:hypothetical protein
MSKFLQCTKCGNKVPFPEFIPDSDTVCAFLSAPLDCNGNPLFDYAKLEVTSTIAAYTCPWCEATMSYIEESDLVPPPLPKFNPQEVNLAQMQGFNALKAANQMGFGMSGIMPGMNTPNLTNNNNNNLNKS